MEENKKTKLLGTIIGVVLFVVAIAGLTYAAFSWRSSNVIITGKSECFTINYEPGPTLDNENVILFDESEIISNNTINIKNGMALTSLTVGIDSECTINGRIIINLTANSLNPAYTGEGQSTGAFKYAVTTYDPATYQTISVSSLAGNTFDIIKKGSITDTSSITIADDEISTTIKGYLVIFYVDGDLAKNDAQDSTFSATITGIATQTE